MVNVGSFFLSWSDNSADTVPIIFGPLFGWGIGIIVHFVSIYAGASPQQVQRVYRKSKEQTK